MIAVVHCEPGIIDRLLALQAVADLLVRLNELWLRAQLLLGAEPPRRAKYVAPPWGTPLRWKTHHGAPLGVARHYYAAPSLFGLTAGTCVDLLAYDVAAMRVLDRRDVVLEVAEEPQPGQYHAWLRVGAERVDYVRREYGG